MGFKVIKSVNPSFLLALGVLSIQSVNVYAQSADPANREYGRTTLIKKTQIINAPNTGPVRDYGNHSLIKASASAGDADYQTWVDALEKKIANVQGPKKFLGQVIISFTVNKDGTISNAKVAKSSNMPQIDTAALAAVQAAGPFGAMPKSRTKPILVEATFDGTSSGTTTHALVKNP